MQPPSKSHTNLFIVVGVLVAMIVAGYFYFTRDRSSDELLTSDAVTAVQNDLVVVLRKLQSVTLDGSILSAIQEPTLHDGSQALVPETPGRSNPFAPLPSLVPIPSATKK